MCASRRPCYSDFSTTCCNYISAVIIIANLRNRPRPQIFPLGPVDRGDDSTPGAEGETSLCLSTRGGDRYDPTAQTYIANCLSTRQSPASGTQRRNHENFIATGVADRGREGGTQWEARSDGLANTVRTAGGRGSTPHVAVGYRGHTPSKPGEIAKTLKAGVHGVPGGEGLLDEGYRIRRLTPVECERLQGFPDNWTQGVSDTQRYKQMGNAVTVNVIEAIARMLPTVQV